MLYKNVQTDTKDSSLTIVKTRMELINKKNRWVNYFLGLSQLPYVQYTNLASIV